MPPQSMPTMSRRFWNDIMLDDSMPDHGVHPLATALTASTPCEHTGRFQFGDIWILVRSNRADLLEALDDYFREFRASHAPPHDEILITVIDMPANDPRLDIPGDYRDYNIGREGRALKERYFDLEDGRVVHKVRTGMRFIFGSDLHLAVGPARDNIAQVVNFINNRCIHRHLLQGALLGHASGVCRDGNAMVIAAASGSGKSTLALRLLDDPSLALLSNDRVMIHRQGPESSVTVRVDGVAKHPRVNPGTLLGNERLVEVLDRDARDQYTQMPIETLRDVEHKFDVMMHEIYGKDRFVLDGQLSACVFLAWRWDAPVGSTQLTRIDIAQRRDLLSGLIKCPGLFFLQPGRSPGTPETDDPELYVQALRGIPCYAMGGRVDFQRGAELASRLLDASSPESAGPAG